MTFLKNQENVRIRINKIDEENWWKTTNNLLWYDENAENTTIQEENLRGLDDSKLTELTEALKATKTEKTAVWMALMPKYRGLTLHLRLLHVYNKC